MLVLIRNVFIAFTVLLGLAALSVAGANAGTAVWAPGLRWVPAERRDALWCAVRDLRAAGERVIGALNESEAPTDDCDREFVWQKNAWRVQTLKRRR